MKLIINFVFFFILFSNINAQNVFIDEEPVLIKEEMPKRLGAAMRYRFPDSVSNFIDMVLGDRLTDKSNAYLELIVEGNDTYKIFIYAYSKHKKNKKNQLDMMVSSTNRYYLYSKIKIPIIFQTDFRLSFGSFTYTGCDGYIRFIAKGWRTLESIVEMEYTGPYKKSN